MRLGASLVTLPGDLAQSPFKYLRAMWLVASVESLDAFYAQLPNMLLTMSQLEELHLAPPWSLLCEPDSRSRYQDGL